MNRSTIYSFLVFFGSFSYGIDSPAIDFRIDYEWTFNAFSMPRKIYAPDFYSFDPNQLDAVRICVFVVDGNAVESTSSIDSAVRLADGFLGSVRWNWQLPDATGAILFKFTRSNFPEDILIVPEAELDEPVSTLVEVAFTYPRSVHAVVSGFVDVELLVDPAGVPVTARAVRASIPAFAMSACLTALMHRFTGGSAEGVPVYYSKMIRVQWNIHGDK